MIKIVKRLAFLLFIAIIMTVLIVPGMVRAQDDVNTTLESIVVFKGNNENNEGYFPNETVHVDVRAPNRERFACEAIVDQTGSWSCSINLWEKSRITGVFYYKARGLKSGVTFTNSFSIQEAIQAIQIFNGNIEISKNDKVNIGSVIDAKILINSGKKIYKWGSTKYQIIKRPCTSNNSCEQSSVYKSDCLPIPEPDLITPATDQQFIFKNVFNQIESNVSYYLMFTTFSDGNCKMPNGDQWYFSNEFSLQKNETVTVLSCNKTVDIGMDKYVCTTSVKRSSGTGNPSGKIEFSTTPNTLGSLSFDPCVLSPSTPGQASCSTTLAANITGEFQIQAKYQSDNKMDLESSSDWKTTTFSSVIPIITVKADALEKTYGTADPSLSFTYAPSDLAIGFSGSLTRAPGEEAGEYKITLGTLAAEGYKINFIPAELRINKAKANIQIKPFSGVYDGEEHGLSGKATGITGEDLTSLLGFGDGVIDVPGGNVSWSFKGNTNYLAEDGKQALVVISPKELEITADVLSKTYGEGDPILGYKITNGTLINEDRLSGSIARDPGENTGLFMVTQGSLTAGDNYRISFIGSWFKINKRPISVSADPQSKQFGSADPLLTFHITSGDLVNGDMFNGSLARIGGEEPGVYQIDQGSLYLSENYELNFKGSTLSIYQASSSQDDDKDGQSNSVDNCVFQANPDQKDSDKDGFGDVCDSPPSSPIADVIVPVTGNLSTSKLSCSGDTTLKLESNDFVTLPKGVCNLTGIASKELETSLPAALPKTNKFTSVINLTLLEDQKSRDILNGTDRIVFSFKLANSTKDLPLSILFWDPTLKQNQGSWVELPACSSKFPVALHSGEPADKRMILSCAIRTGNHRYEFTTNFPGLFVLVAR